MHPRSDERRAGLCSSVHVRNAVEKRLLIGGCVLAALSFAAFSAAWTHTALESFLDLRPWAHMTLEAALNLFWVLLAFGAVVCRFSPGAERHLGQRPALISLIFALALLFPVVSANDDIAQLDLINDARTSQSLCTVLKSDKQVLASAALPGMPVLPAGSLPPSPARCLSSFVPEPVSAVSVATPGDATGNHSPPVV